MLKPTLFILLLMFSFAQTWAASDDDEDQEEVEKPSIAYVSLGKPMVLNLSGAKLAFLQLSADVLVRNADSKEIIETHIPAIRHSLIVLLSEQNARDIKSPAKREDIRKQATAQVQELILDISGNEDVADILFSNILVQ